MQEKTWGDFKDFLIQGLEESKSSPFASKNTALFVPIFKDYIENRTAEFLEEVYGKETMQELRKV